MFSGVIHIGYVLGERRTFVYHNPSPCEIVYYVGQKITGQPPFEYKEDFTFVCFDDRESAVRAGRRSNVCHERVSQAEWCTYNADLRKHILWFRRFDGFLPEADLKFLAGLEDPNSSFSVPGNPNINVQHEIRELSKALEHMQSQGVSSSLLHLPIGYVWSSGRVKIIMLDVEHKEDHTSAQWNKIIARNVNRFGTGLDKFFLKTSLAWPEKDSFMRCFSIRIPVEDRRMDMIISHPFLMNNLWNIFRVFPRVYWFFSTRHYEEGIQLARLMAALNNKQFKAEFMPNGEWTRQEMSPEFLAFLRGDGEGDVIKYNTRDMGDLVRCLRNVFENGRDDTFLLEARRYWPNLADRVYEKLDMSKDSKLI